jgi:hypothetical protein
MYQVRDVFRCKPGKAKDLAARFKELVPSLERDDHFTNCRVMVDAVADYWTVVIEAEFEKLEDFERHMTEFGRRPEVARVLAGYMDLVEGGRREIYRIV